MGGRIAARNRRPLAVARRRRTDGLLSIVCMSKQPWRASHPTAPPSPRRHHTHGKRARDGHPTARASNARHRARVECDHRGRAATARQPTTTTVRNEGTVRTTGTAPSTTPRTPRRASREGEDHRPSPPPLSTALRSTRSACDHHPSPPLLIPRAPRDRRSSPPLLVPRAPREHHPSPPLLVPRAPRDQRPSPPRRPPPGARRTPSEPTRVDERASASKERVLARRRPGPRHGEARAAGSRGVQTQDRDRTNEQTNGEGRAW